MRHRAFLVPLITIALLGVGAVAVYAYDASRDDLVAEGVLVGGVDVGGMRAGAARAKIDSHLAERLERGISVKVGRREFTLPPEKARIRADVEGMVQEALAVSRSGNILSRTVRGIRGERVHRDIEPRVDYSRAAVDALVQRVKRRVDRKPKNASVAPSASGLTTVAAKNGVAVRGRELRAAVEAELVQPTADGVVEARTKVTKPKVTTDQLAKKYPYYITVDRSTFKLRFFKNLKLAKTYTVAVGAAGYDTPTGIYHIQNKAENPVWNVPNSDWAGKLAGKTIPPGPQNPLKARWMGIYNGAGIHGTDSVGSIGSAASHGCIRMRIPEVIELYDQVPTQTPVFIGN